VEARTNLDDNLFIGNVVLDLIWFHLNQYEFGMEAFKFAEVRAYAAGGYSVTLTAGKGELRASLQYPIGPTSTPILFLSCFRLLYSSNRVLSSLF